MRVLFVSYLADPSSSGRQRLAALRALGHDAVVFPLDEYDAESAVVRRLRLKLGGTFYRPAAVEAAGRALLSAVERVQPDLVWAEKPLSLTATWIRRARDAHPAALFACFQDDDPFGSRLAERPVWRNFVGAIPEYDVHFVKKQANLAEFSEHGAKRVLLFMHGLHAPLFHPRAHPPAWAQKQVVFVGAPLDHRVDQIERLLDLGLPLDIFGNSWRRHRVYWRHRNHFHGPIVAERYATLLAASKICLGFVSSSNRDEYSMRSFEIPGSGSLLLAERTPTHLGLFEEGKEAEFFDSVEECASKCRFYLEHEEARKAVARAGYERCVRPSHSLESRMRQALAELA
ncbi:MAG: hypothetical protein JWN04_2696 [Myxococcaceae bacterium]|nr:hypothetical protein [Myxococcaceae bacterium]